jgi:hypothetical protein
MVCLQQRTETLQFHTAADAPFASMEAGGAMRLIGHHPWVREALFWLLVAIAVLGLVYKMSAKAPPIRQVHTIAVGQ